MTENSDLYRSLGRIEAKLENMHGDILHNAKGISNNRDAIQELQAFRHRVRGGATLGGMLISAAATAAAVVAKVKGVF